MEHHYNFTTVLERLPSQLEAFAQHLYPEGKRIGENWCVSSEGGGKGQSFQISLKPNKAGQYIDRSDPAVSGNAIGLVALRRGIGYQEAGEWLAKYLGVPPEQRFFERKQRPKPVIEKDKIKPLSPSSIAYAQSRKISEKLLRQLKVASSDNTIVFPHFSVDGELVMLKFIPTDGSKKMWTNKDPIHTLFGKELVDPIKSGGKLIITEGQWDAMSWMELGYPAVSIPSGVSNDQWIEEDWTFLNLFTEIYLDYDNDPAGRDAEARVKIRLGYDRCKALRYNYKDANEAFKLGHGDALEAAFVEARDAPVDHIIIAADIKHVVKDLLSENRKSTGVPFFLSTMRKLEFRPHEMTLWYGHTGHGKSTALMNQFAFQVGLGIPGMIASFEDNSPITYSTILKQFSSNEFIGGDPQYDEWYDELTSKLFLFDSMRRTDPDIVIATMTLAHKQLGICNFAVDNVMTMEIDRQDNLKQAEAADKLRVFVSRYPVHLHLAAHPRKGQEANVVRPPQISEIRGASEWGDMAQNAICVYRDMKKAERISEMYDENMAIEQIGEYRRSMPDGKYIVRKQRFNGELPVCSYQFDSHVKRFWRTQEDRGAYWDPSKT